MIDLPRTDSAREWHYAARLGTVWRCWNCRRIVLENDEQTDSAIKAERYARHVCKCGAGNLIR